MMTKIFMLCLLITMILFFISAFLKGSKELSEKMSPFECGFDPNHESRSAFSLRFFILTIIFLIFDTEITLMLPLPLNKNSMFFSNDLASHILLFLFLFMGLIFEWKQSALNWTWFYI